MHKVKWKEMLAEIYKATPNRYSTGPEIYFADSRHPLAKKLKISGQEVAQALPFLENQKLIKRQTNFVKRKPPEKSYNYQILELTEKGFNVANKNEQIESQKQFTTILTLATAVTALVSVMNFMFGLIKGTNWVIETLLYVFIIALTMIFGSVLGKFLSKILSFKET